MEGGELSYKGWNGFTPKRQGEQGLLIEP